MDSKFTSKDGGGEAVEAENSTMGTYVVPADSSEADS